MQYNFLVELPVLEEWGVADIAGPKYVSVVIDSKGTDLSNLVEQLQGAQFKDVGVPQGNSAVDMTLKFFAKEGFAAARRIAMVSAKEYAESASAAVEARCEQEYQRMNHLLTMRGKGGNSALSALASFQVVQDSSPLCQTKVEFVILPSLTKFWISSMEKGPCLRSPSVMLSSM